MHAARKSVTNLLYLDIADNGDGGVNLGELLNGQDGRHEGGLGTIVLGISLNAHQLVTNKRKISISKDSIGI
jgi:hypothetical protein